MNYFISCPIKYRSIQIPKAFAFIILFSFSFNARAQGIPVYDNTSFLSLTQQLVEAGKHTSKLTQTAQFLKQQKENIEKVNNVVKQLRAVSEITRNNQILVTTVNRDLRTILNSPYIKADEVEQINTSFQTLVDHSLETMDLIDQVLSSNALKMNDGQRAALLMEKQEESKEIAANVTLRTKRYKEIISFRELQDKINNRQTDI